MIDYTHPARIAPVDPSIWRVPVQDGPIVLKRGESIVLGTSRVIPAPAPIVTVGGRIDYRKRG